MFLAWCVLPGHNNGATIIYENVSIATSYLRYLLLIIAPGATARVQNIIRRCQRRDEEQDSGGDAGDGSGDGEEDGELHQEALEAAARTLLLREDLHLPENQAAVNVQRGGEEKKVMV